jgi:multidrug efflux system membrane fusion protein
VKLRAEFLNADYALFPSQFVNIKCHIDTRKNVVLIPAQAVQRGSDGTFVYKATPDNAVTVQPVKTGTGEGEIVEITDGIKAGDIVVTDGADSLREGTRIETPAAAPSPHPADKQPAPHKHKKKADSE